eukprot:m.108902 g.108902  ORF g.108902 m.108902 type:complete len:602 (+) comp21235_c0_seq1:786-2591(+)
MADEGRIKIRRALVSVFDKAGIEVLGKALKEQGVSVISTGGTGKKLAESGLDVIEVASITKWPEMLDGRVKTLHPCIHGGLLANRANPAHMETLKELNVEPIDLVVCNLYQFEKAVAEGKPFEGCIEMIDIGGPTMVRAAAKNCDSVAIATSPEQYAEIIEELKANDGTLSKATRRSLARTAFALTAKYDAAVASYFCDQTDAPPLKTRQYAQEFPLKYGVNPHQKPAALSRVVGYDMPFEVINGAPGYTNLMDALNSWQLVSELEAAVGLPAAASFKHVSPAGAAVGVPLSDEMLQVYEATGVDLSPTALAYLRARNADPMSSFGDFIAISGVVDVATAKLIKREVSDGIIARGFEPEALEILKAKKGGKYLVLQGNPDFIPPTDEFKEVYGVAVSQKRNDAVITKDLLKEVVTKEKVISEAAGRDLLIATIAVKYTQSNSVCFAAGGQVVGVGAGQQSRVDCVKLAGRKVLMWHLRQHPKVMALKFKEGVKRVDRVNARVAYINDDMTPPERALWEVLFAEVPEMLTPEERKSWCDALTGVALSSDAFFPFRDNIDQATKYGVKFIVQPGGSNGDPAVIGACDDYGMTMAMSGLRLFHH